MAGVAMLRWPAGMRRQGDLPHPEAVVSRAAVLQQPHADRTDLDGFPIARANNRHVHAGTSCRCES